jgi:hypothetical protein
MTRSELKKAKDQALDMVIKKQEEEEKVEEDAGLEFLEAIDILAKYDAAWQDRMAESKNWQEKKKELD